MLVTQRQIVNRWQRPRSPQPETALVFVNNRDRSFVVYEGELGLTQGEILFGGYHQTFFEVDLKEQHRTISSILPCIDGSELIIEIELTYVVQDPATVVHSTRTDTNNIEQLFNSLVTNVLQHQNYKYSSNQSQEAQNVISHQICAEVEKDCLGLSIFCTVNCLLS